MKADIFATPRAEPNKLLPTLGGALVLACALPVFLILGWSLRGWGLALVLWLGLHAADLLLTRLRSSTGNLAASGVLAFGLTFKTVAVLGVLVAAAAANPHVALAAAVVYALSYTLELGLSLASYFGARP